MSELDRRSRATAFVERVLRVPPPPDAPAGTHESIRVFRGAPGLYRYQLLVWLVRQLATAAGLAVGISVLAAIPHFPTKKLLELLEWMGVAIFVASLPFTFLMVHLDYQLRWYIVTDRSLRIREGLWKVNERTMSFANIQNLSVRQGPIQRLLGIADLEVHSAGGGGARRQGHEKHQEDLHVGKFRGVDNAEEIRDSILARVRQLRDSGLGDPDAVHHELPAEAPGRQEAAAREAIAAARELLAEVRALRESWHRASPVAP